MRSDGPHARSAAAHAACEHLYRGLARWLGAEGCRGLFIRVLDKLKPEQPALSAVEIRDSSGGWALDGVAASVAAHGDAAVAEALELVLVELIDLLGRFIGADLVVTLAAPSRPDAPSDPAEG